MKIKSTICLLTILAIFTFASAYLALPVKAQGITVEFLNHWTEPSEVYYWANITKYYNENVAPAGVQIKMTSVEFDILYDTIMTRHAAGQDPDIMHIHAMWIPAFANWKSHILAVPPGDVQADVVANWTDVTEAGSAYKSIVWGYPSEFNSWALVYNRQLIQNEIAARTGENKTFLTNVLAKLEGDVPITWDELTVSAQLLTKYQAGKINQTGFSPFIEGMPEEQRYQFMSLLWSNNAEYLDLNTPKVLFNSTNGIEVMKFYNDLGYKYNVYDPLTIPDYWWNAWAREYLAMIILPTWMTYVRDAMPEGRFNHLGVAPIPIGPHGTESVSATYNWINVVSQRAEDEGRATAAWDFLKWINKPRPQYDIPLPGATSIGPVPKGNNCTIMGDYLIRDSIVPSRADDQKFGQLTVVVDGQGTAGDLISNDFWFKGFMHMGGPDHGRADQSFLKTKEIQYEIGQMFEKVTLTGADPTTAVQETAAKIMSLTNPLLPMPGDIDINGKVEIFDAVYMIKDIDAKPSWGALWYRGRSDIDDSGLVDVFDITTLSVNYGKIGGY